MNLEKANFRLIGNAKYVFQMLEIIATTRLLETDRNWWAIRARLIAYDMDRQQSPTNLWLRRN